MASGDAQRAWFPEMISKLTTRWEQGMSWEECTIFCHDMTEFREEIRNKKNIKRTMRKCSSCGGVHEMTVPPIGIRSMLFALKKTSVINDEQFKELEKSCKKHQRALNLDGYGNKKSD